jgi:HSP20 family molecular chaperone IbpA
MTTAHSPAGSCNARPVYRPHVRIVELADAVELIAEVPGADENSTDIELENNTLTVTARVVPVAADGQKVIYTEVREGDYRRSFQLSEDIDRQRIEARVKDGILRVRLPKVAEKQPQKIHVLAG